MSAKTLGKIAVGLMFPLVGMAYLTQRKIAGNFADQTYYKEAVELIKGYKPMLNRLGEPVSIRRIEVNDSFNYMDLNQAKVKIPLEGKLGKANVLAYANKIDNRWSLDYMEIEYPNNIKYKFYDSKLVDLSNSEDNSTSKKTSN